MGINPPKTIPKAAERIVGSKAAAIKSANICAITAVSYTHLRAHET